VRKQTHNNKKKRELIKKINKPISDNNNNALTGPKMGKAVSSPLFFFPLLYCIFYALPYRDYTKLTLD